MNYNYGTRCPEGLLQPNSIMIAYTVPLGQKVRHLNVSLLRAGSMELVCYRPPVGASTLVNRAWGTFIQYKYYSQEPQEETYYLFGLLH